MGFFLPFFAGFVIGNSSRSHGCAADKARLDAERESRMRRYSAEDERRKKLHDEIRRYVEEDKAKPENTKPTA